MIPPHRTNESGLSPRADTKYQPLSLASVAAVLGLPAAALKCPQPSADSFRRLSTGLFGVASSSYFLENFGEPLSAKLIVVAREFHSVRRQTEMRPFFSPGVTGNACSPVEVLSVQGQLQKRKAWVGEASCSVSAFLPTLQPRARERPQADGR